MLGYRAAIFAFLDSRYGSVRKKKDSTIEEREQYEKLAEKFMKGKVVPLSDLKRFKDYLVEKKRPPHSISQGVTCVRIWFEHYGHELSSKDMRELKKHMPSQRTGVTREGELSPEIIRNIIDHTGDSRLKAVILLMLSSGIRVGELVQLNINDVDLKKNTVYISDLIAKTGVSRITFFSDEARDAISSYLNEREMYIERSKKFTPRLKKEFKESKKLFPITPDAIRTGLNATLKKAGLHEIDPRTDRANIHPHSFRKYFSSSLKLAKCPEDIVEYWMGHLNGVSSVYRVYNEKQLREQYKQFEFCLLVDYSYQAQKEMKSQLEEHNGIIKNLEKERDALKERLQQLEQTQDIKKKIEETDLYKKIMADVEQKLKK